MSIENPTNRVHKKQGKPLPKLAGPGQLPSYSGTNPAETEKRKLTGFADLSEIDYLKRLSLRSNLAGTPYNVYVPDLSEHEIVVGSFLEKLNNLNRDPTKRMVMQNLYHRFNSSNLFNIAQELASLKMARQSVQEMEALVDHGVESMVEKATGVDSASAKRASARKAFAAANARVDINMDLE